MQQKSGRFRNLSLASTFLVFISGCGLLFYFNHEKEQLETKRAQEQSAGAGRPLVGGPFSLVDHNGRPVTDVDFRGKWMLVYFGYTFCPDVCPEELEKMAEVVDALAKSPTFASESITPIFISCDPKRDSVQSIREYLKDFHPTFLGLTGTHAQIKRIAKAYRLYFSAPPKAVDDDETDYLVDHSIFFYLMGPDGKYRAHFGRNEESGEVVGRILREVRLERGEKV
ncbi:Cu-binding protein [Rhizophlyctis rosea]|uniref:Cu-binding protein n=1 Tax=Rhizophlyctis rosea TaxID=64517 RepID=A0AAD5SDS2_9FUNG|nr:Cu-binding protein [Rhizophlyctis rosea]